MRTLVSLALLVSLSACASTGGEGEWESLFDGETTSGWRGFKKEACPDGWQVVDGTLTLVGGGGDIITTEQYESFELQLEWKISEAGNSGIFFHVTEDHDYVWQTGPEMQILDNAKHHDGGDPKTSAGANYALHAPPADVTMPIGEWNQVRLIVNAGHVTHWLNGRKQCEYDLWSDDWIEAVRTSKFKDMPDYGLRESGHIALQDHGDRVSYRGIRIRRL